jgi:hypothetical protein
MTTTEFIVKATPAFYELIETEIKGTYTLKVIKNPNKNPEPSPEDLNIMDTPNNIELVETETKGTYDVIIKNVVISLMKVAIYKPNETQEIFKGMFKSVVEELNKPYTLKQTKNIMIIELKQYILIRKGLFNNNTKWVKLLFDVYYSNGEQKCINQSSDILYDEPNYNGNCYTYTYVSKYHPKVKYPNVSKFNRFIDFYRHPSFEDIKNDERIEEWFVKRNSHLKFNEKDWEKTIYSNNEYNECVNSWMKFRNSEGDGKKNKSYYPYKLRVLEKSLDYSRTPMNYRSIFNLKYWDKTTKLTSLRGLKANGDGWTYSNSNKKSRMLGWTFGGLTAVDIEVWAIKNGFQKEIIKVNNKGKKNEKTHYKKYQYGDYAEYMCKIFGGYIVNEYLLNTTKVIMEKRIKK